MSSSTTAVNTTAPGLRSSQSEAKKSPIRITNGKNFVQPEELDRLLDTVDIVSLIESYELPGFQRTSPNKATCLCPFHDDHNPSLQINGERGIYKCFSCGAGGNALKFVREYSEKFSDQEAGRHGSSDQNHRPLSFVEAVRVLEDHASTTPMVGGVMRRRQSGVTSDKKTSQSSHTKKKPLRKVGSTPRSRILHANLFAAVYFEESLFGLPSAGSARMHLRSRGVLPTTVKRFAMGFAPESYFLGGKDAQQSPRAWGDGSLVHRLRDEGFTPQEILDAGLAIVTKKGKELQKQQPEQKENRNETTSDDGSMTFSEPQPPEHKDFSTLMDRFRGRLIVPIFDATGTHVLGFGGRILETSEDSNPDFKAAKYLNSPESLVFRKKELLFGQHMVEVATDDTSLTSSAAKRRARSLIVVEGYMDAIALWQAGVKETVASMGTALTKEQLLAATQKAKEIGGRVVLCLDNDTAGVAAVTRLCSGRDPILLSVTEESNIEIFVAQLPGSVKDPAEFLEDHRDTEEALDEKFRADVIDGAQEWSRWYMNSLVDTNDSMSTNKTDSNDGGFGKLFDTLASFLSTFENVDKRMKRAAIIAPKLANLVDTSTENDDDANRVEILSSIRIQLASDLIEKAANIAHSKAVNAQKNFLLSSGKEPLVPKSLEISQSITLEEKSKGTKSFEISQDVALEEGFKSTSNKKKSSRTPPHIRSASRNDRSSRQKRKTPIKRKQTQMRRRNTMKQFRKPMTNHVSSIEANPLDEEWLGVTRNKYTNQRNPLGYASSKSSNKTFVGSDSCVRFNDNDYHGTWATPEAINAGYESQPPLSKNLDFLEKGTSSLIVSDGESQSIFVENLLFSILVRFVEARRSLYEYIRISEASGSRGDVQWSTPEKQWLFKCLVEEMNDIPKGIVGLEHLSELRSYLINRPDAIPGALSPILEDVEVANSKHKKEDEEVITPNPSSIVDVTVDEISPPLDNGSPQKVESTMNYNGDLALFDGSVTEPSSKVSTNSIPKIPAIGEEWSGFTHTEDYNMAEGMSDFGENFGVYDDPMVFGDIDDALMDSIGPIEESLDPTNSNEFIDQVLPSSESTAVQVDSIVSVDDSETTDETEIVDDNDRMDFADVKIASTEDDDEICNDEGSLDHFFRDGAEMYEIFHKFYAEADSVSVGRNEDKAKSAAQDLYGMLHYTSLSKRVESARLFMAENEDDWFNMSSIDNIAIEGLSSSMAITMSQNIKLAKYCSSQDPDGGLRSDLNRLRILGEKNNQSTERMLSMMNSDFTDRSEELRGYNWLGNVLKFNQMKAVEWNDIIEAKSNFQHSHEDFEALEDIVYSDWDELCDENELWDFEKNVDLNHRSHFTDVLVVERPDSESPEDFAERYEAEWDVDSWEHEYDQGQERGGEEIDDAPEELGYNVEESPEEFLEELETDWGDHDI